MIVQIDTGYACFGLVVENGIVIEAPPIAKWTLGKTINEVTQYFSQRKNGKIVECNG